MMKESVWRREETSPLRQQERAGARAAGDLLGAGRGCCGAGGTKEEAEEPALVAGF